MSSIVYSVGELLKKIDEYTNNLIKSLETKEEVKFKLNDKKLYCAKFPIENMGNIQLELDENKKVKSLFVGGYSLFNQLTKEEKEKINHSIKEIMNNSKMRVRYLLNQKAY